MIPAWLMAYYCTLCCKHPPLYIFSWLHPCLLTGVRSWPSRATCSLWMSRTVLSESLVASAVHFTTVILLMVDLHAFSFSKKAWTFSTICLVYDLSLTPFLPGVQGTLCSSELLELLAPSVDLLFGLIPTYYV